MVQTRKGTLRLVDVVDEPLESIENGGRAGSQLSREKRRNLGSSERYLNGIMMMIAT